jgi:hypothetical protein
MSGSSPAIPGIAERRQESDDDRELRAMLDRLWIGSDNLNGPHFKAE